MKGLLPILSLLILLSCSRENEPATLLRSLSPTESGVTFVNELTESEAFNMIEYLYFNNGGGVAAGDINNDGLVDLYFSGNQCSNRLYLNKGGLRFEDITEQAGVGGRGDWSTGVSMADVNGDGLLDIYQCNVGGYKGLEGRNELFINRGNFQFTEEAARYGLDFEGFSTQAAFLDYDGDGDLDLYLLNHAVHSSRSYGSAELRYEQDPRAGDRLYRNEQKEVRDKAGEAPKPLFRDVTAEAGILSSQIGYGLGVGCGDLNNDGWPDIYISNDFHEQDYLYINNGDGSFREELRSRIRATSRSSMGNDIADINNDGWPDIMVLDMLPDEESILKRSGGEDERELFELKRKLGYGPQFVRNTLQLNRGGGQFSEIGRFAGIAATDWSWSPLLCDLDNDGWKDLYITNGIYRRANDLDYIRFLTGGNRYFPDKDNSSLSNRELYEKMPLQADINHAFRNNRELGFTPVSAEWGMVEENYSNGSACADLDNDGDLELVVNNINAVACIYKNQSRESDSTSYLQIELSASGRNSHGVGARVSLWAGGMLQMAEIWPTRGFISASAPVLHFGLDTLSQVDSIHIRWPDGHLQKHYRIEVNQRLSLRQDANDPGREASDAEQEASGAEQEARLTHTPGMEYRIDFKHREDAWSDLDREALIPHELSAEGPALAVADVNGDGLEDLFVGGACDQAARFYLQQAKGRFSSFTPEQLQRDRYTEDVDAAFFDADGDGDMDLYIVRGGNEALSGNPLLGDRLLINDGKGKFELPEKGALPLLTANGSCVRPADFDGDGDMDLFVGSRSIPGAYGLRPEQFLLENNGDGHFNPLPAEAMGELSKAGMLTDACWADLIGDKTPELIVAGEWMPVSVYRWEAGSFKRVAASGLQQYPGMWFSLLAEDLDGDGDNDILAGNLGLNSLLRASQEAALELYVNDFNHDGRPEPILAKHIQGLAYPVATLDELLIQLPGLAEGYSSYKAFAGQSLEQIFGKEALGRSVHYEIRELASCIFLNEGRGLFKRIQLPASLQFSPIRAMASLTAPGVQPGSKKCRADFIMAGNMPQVRPALGSYDAGFPQIINISADKDGLKFRVRDAGFSDLYDIRRIILVHINGIPCLCFAENDGGVTFRSVRNE